MSASDKKNTPTYSAKASRAQNKNGTTTLSIITLSIKTFSKTILNIYGLFATFSINDPQHNNNLNG